MGKIGKKRLCLWMAASVVLATTACGQKDASQINLVKEEEGERKDITLFAPIGKSDPEADNISIAAQELTVIMAEEQLGVTVRYNTYTADDYKEKTYDEVAIDRIHNNMDDFYLLNPDAIQQLGTEGKLADLSGLESVKNLREVVKAANTVNGKLVAIPQEVVVYGLFVNKDMFDQYGLPLPETPEDLLECCRVFKENGIETPIGANRWWLENFVLAQAYADLYNGGDTKAQIEALNSGEAKYSDYMRPGFEYLKQLMELGYIDAKTALTYEAIEGEGPAFLAQKTPIVMAYWAAANAETAYGKPDFNMQVIGFPSSRGQMPIVSMTGYGVNADSENLDDTLATLDIMISDAALSVYTENNQVISPSKNVEVNCIAALNPLNDRVNEGVYVLGSNASMNVEQWGNTCLIVRELLNGASIDECMSQFDQLQEEALQNP